MDGGFEPHLAAGDVTVTGRDVAALRAVDRHGSLSAAADALGRSYGHLQRRVVELEDALGELTTPVVETGRLNAYGSESTGSNLFLSLAGSSEVIALEIGWGFNHRLFLGDGC
jgi:hypothetical protein